MDIVKIEVLSHALTLLFGAIFGFIADAVFRPYLSTKFKNLATKQDIKIITDKVESVRHDYAIQLERAKTELSSKLKTHGFRYEKEYEVLCELNECLVNVLDACDELRPIIEFVDCPINLRPSNTPEGKVDLHNEADLENLKDMKIIKEKRLAKLDQALRKLRSVMLKKKPFYSEAVYLASSDVLKQVGDEYWSYLCANQFKVELNQAFYEEGRENRLKISEKAEFAIEKIRQRVIEWEALG
ncbi:hypothetical protein QDG88_13340 [Pseudoalteromonas piscicida]|uniref:hypothetical protein n=1 Tax=Pseudoalteromonas piscicida TaxID=43662 RepID=UPI002738659A|nr:hypothetical protein [Pseudoalteromonas piscicida]MDP4488905.1 hypothetical protein [Pseudoalteromonas piscicida]